MILVSPAHLKDIGLDAAREVVGERRAQENEVSVDLDCTNEPAYFFSFLIEQDSDPMRAALQTPCSTPYFGLAPIASWARARRVGPATPSSTVGSTMAG
jgi:hypothetical protein